MAKITKADLEAMLINEQDTSSTAMAQVREATETLRAADEKISKLKADYAELANKYNAMLDEHDSMKRRVLVLEQDTRDLAQELTTHKALREAGEKDLARAFGWIAHAQGKGPMDDVSVTAPDRPTSGRLHIG